MSDLFRPAVLYAERAAQFAALADGLRQRSARWMQARLLSFLAGLAAMLAALIVLPPGRGWLLIAATMLFAVFALTVRGHRRVRRELTRQTLLAELNRDQQARVERRWSDLPAVRLPEQTGDLATARDLDLIGHASLVQLLGSAHTPLGRALLADWLRNPAPPSSIVCRQQAVAVLAGQLEWRQELEVRTRPLADHDSDVQPFLGWAEGPAWLTERPWVLIAARVLPLAIIVLGVLSALGFVDAAWWILPALVAAAISFARCGAVHEVFARVARREGEIAQYAAAFAWATTLEGTGEALGDLRGVLRSDAEAADVALARLQRIMDLGELRFSPLVWLPLQAVTLWDFHVLALVERWQRQHGRHVRGWLSALARLEGLAALATLRHDQPDWCFPRLDQSPPLKIVARALGHPLLSDRARVTNDVELGPPGSFLLVTGSNMSGKSTLLRAIGCNAALAQCGAPVCAADLSMPAVDVMTSMRVQDSLEDGVSFFLAELKRLKQIVDRADTAGPQERVLLYLLDEILQGTNSAERQTAVREVTLHLLRCQALGAITTHDLQLAEVEPLRSASRAVHFREHVGADQAGRAAMTFDYVLRTGVATTTNALRLLELVGLCTRLEADSADRN